VYNIQVVEMIGYNYDHLNLDDMTTIVLQSLSLRNSKIDVFNMINVLCSNVLKREHLNIDGSVPWVLLRMMMNVSLLELVESNKIMDNNGTLRTHLELGIVAYETMMTFDRSTTQDTYTKKSFIALLRNANIAIRNNCRVGKVHPLLVLHGKLAKTILASIGDEVSTYTLEQISCRDDGYTYIAISMGNGQYTCVYQE
jgi:hypothetical protein